MGHCRDSGSTANSWVATRGTGGCSLLTFVFLISSTLCSGDSSEIKDEVVDLTESHASEKLVGSLGKDGSSSGGSSFFTERVVIAIYEGMLYYILTYLHIQSYMQ